MSHELSDGTVVPSYLGIHDSSFEPSVKKTMTSDVLLRVGTVTKSYPPGDSESTSKLVFEYDVDVYQMNGDSIGTFITYPRCRVANFFGSVADFLEYTPRIDNSDPKDPELNLGSRVLILCPNGDQRDALIVGGFPHPQAKAQSDKTHHLKFEFNGIRVAINSDGELFIFRRGATENDGSTKSGGAGGATLKMDKDGGISILEGGGNQTPQSIVIDTKNSKMEITGYSKMDITCTGPINMKSAGVYLGGDNAKDNLIKGSTYREQEDALFQTMLIAFTAMSAAFQTASSTAPSLAGAGTAAQQVVVALQQFMAQAANYLSVTNLTE